MKHSSMCRLLTALLCLLMAATMLFTACGPDTPPVENNGNENEGNENEGNEGNGGDEVDDKYVKLSDKGNSLYNATYQTMIDRLYEDGYAQTSLTGAYNGMFVRDASIQVMAHIAQGDMDAAMAILKYMAAYHKHIGAKHAIHIMDELKNDYLFDSVVGEKTLPAISNGASGQSVAQMGYDTALFKVVLPSNQAAQTFTVPFDTISEIAIALEVSATAGKLHLLIGTEAGDNSVADLEFDISKITKDGKWVKLMFDEPVSVVPNQTYVFTIGAEIASGNVVAFGQLGAGGAFNYDLPAYGGWIPEGHAMGYQIRTSSTIAGENNAATQTFTMPGDRLDSIDVALTSNEATTAHAKLTDKDGKVLKELTLSVPVGTTIHTLDLGLTVTEGAQYTLTIWTDGGRTSWEMMSEDSHYLVITPEYSGTKLAGSVTLGGSKVASQVLADALSEKTVTSVALYLASVGTVGENDTFTVSLYKGDVLVDEITYALSELSDAATLHTVDFCLPLADVEKDAEYTVEVSASRDGSVKWFGQKDGNSVVLSYTAGCSNVTPISKTVQVDGHYMWMNAFAMFVLEAEANFKGQYDAFINQVYPMMEAYTLYFFETEGAIGGNVGFVDETYGLMYTPSYEHSREGRYWKAFDLITNVFCSEAAHKMSKVATLMDKAAVATTLSGYADSIADAVHENLVQDFNGKPIYIDLIDVENGKAYEGYAYKTEENYRVYLGFSFVNLAPLAADWYAMDAEVMENTYTAYMETSAEKYGKYDMLAVVTRLNENNLATYYGNHVIGKGFAWELFYNWKIGNTERVEEMIEFMEARSTNVYPEVWRKDGSVSDSANQEHANWILYTMARITGKYTAQ